MRNVALVIGLLLLVSMVFAADLTAVSIADILPTSDNIKLYDKDTQTVTIATKDSALIATAKLLTPRVMEVQSGYQMVASIELDGKQITADFLKNMYFFDLKAENKGITRSFDLRVPVEYQLEEPMFDLVCREDDKNFERICDEKEVGTKAVTKTRYDLITEKNMGVEKKIITIWTDVQWGDRVEWIPDLYGVVVEEWGVWTTPTDVNLISWYKLDEVSGTDVNDHKGGFTGTNIDATVNQTGKVGTAYSFDGSASYINTNNSDGNLLTNFSISAWVYPTTIAENDGIILARKGPADLGALASGMNMSSSSNVYFTVNGTLCASTAGSLVANRWNFLVLTYDGANIRGYTDGNLTATCAKTGAILLSGKWFIGADAYAPDTRGFTGKIDEVGFWSTTLTSSDVNNLRVAPANTGVTYCGTGDYVDLFGNPCTLQQGPYTWDVNALTPTLNQLTSGSRDINFMITISKKINADVNIYWSNSAGAKTNLIYNDTNIYDGTGITCAPDYNFIAANRSCKYRWNTVTTGGNLWGNNFYIDYLLHSSDGNTNLASSPVFILDNNGPRTAISGCANPTGWNNTAQTLIFDVNEQSWEFGLYTAGNSIFMSDNFTPFLTSFQPGVSPNYQTGYTVSLDGNHILDLNSFDANNNYTPQNALYGRTKYWCAIDTSTPTVGVTTINTFSTYSNGGNWIKGTGNIIGGAATDGLSGLNISTCQYTANGGGSWAGNTWNTDHCETIGLAVNDSITYTFNTRIRNNAATYGTGTATVAWLGDTSGPITSSNAVGTYFNNATITLTANDGAGSGAKRTWFCTDSLNTCVPTTVGTSVSLTCADGMLCSYYIRAVSMDNLDTNGAAYESGEIIIDRITSPPIPENNSNKWTWLDMTNNLAGSLFGFDYTMLAIVSLLLLGILCFIFKIGNLVAIIVSIPLTYAFLVLAGGTSYLLLVLIILEVAALVLKIAISFFNMGNQGA